MGGIAAVAAIVAASWVLVRRHRRKQQQQNTSPGNPTTHNPNGTTDTPPTGTTFVGMGPIPDGYLHGGHGYYGPPPPEHKDQDYDDKGPGIPEVAGAGHEYGELPASGGMTTPYPYSGTTATTTTTTYGYPYPSYPGAELGYGSPGFGGFAGSSPQSMSMSSPPAPVELDPAGRPVELEQGRYYARPAELDGTAAAGGWR
jgi:hypothetical protein